jgi:ribose/xylose/arabinose/galactoside ABC-type transport system permease subunit
MSQQAQPEAVDAVSKTTFLTKSRAAQFFKQLPRLAIWLILLVLILIAVIVSPQVLNSQYISTQLKQAAPLGVVSIGQTFVILAAGIDLSVASVIALMSVLAANLMAGQDSLVLSVSLLCITVALAIGLFNGILVTKLKIPSFIATLGTVLIVQGIRFLYTGGAPKGSIPNTLRFWGRGSIGPIPTPLILWVVIVLVALFIERRTTFGRRLFAAGGKPSAAHHSGINVDRIVVATYLICSFLAGIAGLMLTGFIGLADNWLGRGYELDSIAAVVIGGTALSGGRGSVLGSVAGVLILTILYNLVLLLGMDVETQRIVKGLTIIVAVALYARMQGRIS